VKSLAVSNPSLSPEDWGFLLNMKKTMTFFRLETFFVASLGVHLLLFLTLSTFLSDTARSLISPPRLEVHLLSIASPAIAGEKPLPKPVSQPPPLKIRSPESAPIEKLNTPLQTASSDAPENENKRIPSVREEEKLREESPAKKAAVEWTESGEESLWIQTAPSSQELFPSALVTSRPQEAKTPSLDGGMQEENIRVAKLVSLLEGESSFIHPRYMNNPKPIYPREAQQRGFQGEVTLRVEVLASGQVGQIEIRRSSGHEILDRSALASVKQWQFVPAKKGKESIPLWVNIPITFRIE
jgi:protein TonB